ncbi:hypothetical protein AB1Y20_007783 [Prymnesium parvum]|uniref:Uncharacterized protein n=1 Tax=Prymnesium parvum TaxID=97485 RepID=A0AB34IUR4_PRYPA
MLLSLLLPGADPSSPWCFWGTLTVHAPILLAWLPLGLAVVRRESHAGMLALLSIASLQLALYVTQLAVDRPPPATPCTSELHAVFPLASPLAITFLCLALALRLALVLLALATRRNFGRGLLRVHQPEARDVSLSTDTRSNDTTPSLSALPHAFASASCSDALLSRDAVGLAAFWSLVQQQRASSSLVSSEPEPHGGQPLRSSGAATSGSAGSAASRSGTE